jgi:hypothetical protein
VREVRGGERNGCRGRWTQLCMNSLHHVQKVSARACEAGGAYTFTYMWSGKGGGSAARPMHTVCAAQALDDEQKVVNFVDEGHSHRVVPPPTAHARTRRTRARTRAHTQPHRASVSPSPSTSPHKSAFSASGIRTASVRHRFFLSTR